MTLICLKAAATRESSGGNGCWSEPPLQSNFTVVIWTPLNLHTFLSIIARYTCILTCLEVLSAWPNKNCYKSTGTSHPSSQKRKRYWLGHKYHKIRLKCNIGCLWVEQSRILHILYDVMYDILICKCWYRVSRFGQKPIKLPGWRVVWQNIDSCRCVTWSSKSWWSVKEWLVMCCLYKPLWLGSKWSQAISVIFSRCSKGQRDLWTAGSVIFGRHRSFLSL